MRKKVVLRDPFKHREALKRLRGRLLIFFLVSLLISGVVFFLFRPSIIVSLILLVGIVIILVVGSIFRHRMAVSARIKKIESLFPDFLQLVSSNLRAGITVDRAMLLSAREEFHPLDKEILKTGRDITVGKTIEDSLIRMSDRIGSDKVAKVVQLIISGIHSGGDLAVLLDEAAGNMRDRSFLEKKAASNVLMYVIFIFIAVSVGAPALFGLSNLLVGVLTNLLGGLPDLSGLAVSTPFSLSKVNISQTFIFYFSLVFIVIIDFLASLILGLVSRGREREGLRYFPVILVISLVVFLVVKFSLQGIVEGMLG